MLLPMLMRGRTMLITRGCVLTISVACYATQVWPAQDPRESLIFHVSFDKKHVRADRAGGEKKPRRPADAAPVEFVEGIRKEGFRCGGTGQTLIYSAEGNIEPEAGTLALWVRGVRWNMHDRDSTEDLVHIGGKGGWTRLYSWIHNPVWLLADRGGKRSVMAFPGPSRGWVEDRWNMVAVSWNGTKCYTYFNGVPVEKKDNFPLAPFAGHIRVGQMGKADKEIWLDELMVFGRALSDAEIAQLSHEVGNVYNAPIVAVPPAGSPPKIDGKVEDDEWAASAKIRGLVDDRGYLARTQSDFFLTYDSRCLYVGLRSPIPERVRNNLDETALHGVLRQAKTEFDTNVDADDAVEIDLVPEFPLGMFHRMVFNHIGTHYDYTISPAGAIQLRWDPKWETATHLDRDGWQAEAAIPFEELNVPAPRPGDVWGINVRRIWKQLQQQIDRWAWGKYLPETNQRFGYYGALGKAVFCGANDSRARVRQITGLRGGSPKVVIDVMNPGQAKRTFAALIQSNAGDLKHEETFSVGPKQTHAFEFTGQIQSPSASRLLVRIDETRERQRRTILQANPAFYQEQRLSLYVRHYPSFEKADVELDLSLLKDQAAADLSAELRLVSAGSKAPVLTRRAERFQHYYPTLAFETKELAVGEYVLEASISARGQEIASCKQPFEKRPQPEWSGNRLGISEEIPPPFEPIRVKRGLIRVWGREIQFGNRLLPAGVKTQGRPVLAAPMSLVLRQGDKVARSADGAGQFEVKSETPARIEFSGQQKLGTLAVRSSGWIEYDGFVWFDITFAPERETPVDALCLDVPFAAEFSTLINNYDYSVRTSGLLPKGGQKSGAHPIWLGNEMGGMQWLNETTATWPLTNQDCTLEVLPQESGAILRVNFVDQPVTLGEPFTVSFGLIATPFRPCTTGYWDELKGTTHALWGYGNYQPAHKEWGNPLAWPDWAYGVNVRPANRNDDRAGKEIHSGPYVMNTSFRVGDSPVGQEADQLLRYWFHEWVADASARYKPGPKTVKVAPSSRSWQDFFLWTYWEMYKRHRYTGLYYDVSRPVQSDNRYAGAGVEVNGRAVATWTLLGNRQFAKRFYTLLRLREPRGSIRYHMSGQPNGAYHAFCEMMVDGENTYSWLSLKQPEYYRHLTLPMFRSQFLGHNFGPVNQWLPQNRRALKQAKDWLKVYPDGAREVEHILGLALLHNTALWPAYFPRKYLEPTLEALRAYELNNTFYDFHGYWTQRSIRAQPDQLAVSIYRAKKWRQERRHKDRTLIVLFNNTPYEGPAKLTIDWSALGYPDPADLRIENCSHDTPVARNGSELGISITHHTFRLLGIRREPGG